MQYAQQKLNFTWVRNSDKKNNYLLDSLRIDVYGFRTKGLTGTSMSTKKSSYLYTLSLLDNNTFLVMKLLTKLI